MSLAEKLHALHLLDQQMRGLKTRLDAATRRKDIQQRKLDQFQRQRDELAEQHKLAQARAAGFENDVRSMEERINKYREQMNSVKTNKEYSALLLEVNTLKADKSKVEDQALEQLSRAEILAAEVAAADEQVAQQGKIVAGADAEVATCRAEVGDRLDEVTAQRNAAAALVPRDALEQFERVANEHDGEAMVSVAEESRKHMEYTCGGCYMTIPVERLNSLMVGADVITTCPSCGRILYLDEELRASFAR